MNPYDIKLSLLRRRLLLALKHQKAYMDSMYIEYTGAEFETHVRPSNPFDAGSVDMNASAAFAEIRNPAASHIGLSEDMEGSIDMGVNTPDLLIFYPNVDIGGASGVTLDDIWLTKPTDVGFEGIEAIVNAPGNITVPNIAPMTNAIDAVCDMAATASFISMPQIDYDGVEIVPDVSLTLSSVRMPPMVPNDIGAIVEMECSMSNINMPTLQLTGADIIHDIDVGAYDAPSQPVQLDTYANAAIGSDINIGLYVAATLTNINNATLESLEDMALNEEYVLYGIYA